MQHIHWPALLHYQGDPELQHIDSEQQWLQDYAVGWFSAEDRLIDSLGDCYHSLSTVPELAGRLELPELNDLLRQHFAASGACCVAKLLVASVPEAIQAVTND